MVGLVVGVGRRAVEGDTRTGQVAVAVVDVGPSSSRNTGPRWPSGGSRIGVTEPVADVKLGAVAATAMPRDPESYGFST